tara:strand:+ start:222 stop:494 length:273 start_codon:yes stop_codon:yes gene_type:complete
MAQFTPTPRADDYEFASADLKSWAKSFKLKVDEIVDEIDEIVKEDYRLTGNAPSKYAVAEMCFRQIQKKKRELDSALVDFEKAFTDAVQD